MVENVELVRGSVHWIPFKRFHRMVLRWGVDTCLLNLRNLIDFSNSFSIKKYYYFTYQAWERGREQERALVRSEDIRNRSRRIEQCPDRDSIQCFPVTSHQR